MVCFCVSDFQEVLNLEPGNKQALNELQKLQAVCLESIIAETPTHTHVCVIASLLNVVYVCIVHQRLSTQIVDTSNCISSQSTDPPLLILGAGFQWPSSNRAQLSQENRPANRQTRTSALNCEFQFNEKYVFWQVGFYIQRII